jgi:hypothetical protein
MFHRVGAYVQVCAKAPSLRFEGKQSVDAGPVMDRNQFRHRVSTSENSCIPAAEVEPTIANVVRQGLS